jgi:hypothetical protein
MEINKIVKESLESAVFNLDLPEDRYDEMLSFIEKKGDRRRQSAAGKMLDGAARLIGKVSFKDFVEVAAVILILIAIPAGIRNFNKSSSIDPSVNPGGTVIEPAETSKPLKDYGVIQKYFPLKKQTLFFNGGFENEGYQLTTELIKDGKLQMRKIDTAIEVIFVLEMKENLVTKVYVSPEDGTAGKDFTDMEKNANEVMLKLPLEKGTKWDNDGLISEITAVDVEVSTPSGTYKALEVTTKHENTERKVYYAEGIGPVKFITKFSDGYTNVEELLKVETDEQDPIKEAVEKYYMDAEPDNKGELKIYITKKYKNSSLVLTEKYFGDGHSYTKLLILDENHKVVAWAQGEMPISMCFSVNSAEYDGIRILYGNFNKTKWDMKTDKKVEVQIDRVVVKLEDVTIEDDVDMDKGFIIITDTTSPVVGFYLYNKKDELQSDLQELGEVREMEFQKVK